MVSGVLSLTTIPLTLCPKLPSKFDSKRSFRYQPTSCSTIRVVKCSNSSPESPATAEKLHDDASVTGGAIDFQRATTSLTQKLLSAPKKVTLVRHGLSSWNNEGRVQGSSNLSILTEIGIRQAERCREALKNIHFDQCFSSPISRAKNLEAADARQIYPKEYTTWRENPADFYVNGVYPISVTLVFQINLFDVFFILIHQGENILVVPHKSILKALICTALGLPPERFRSVDVNNGGISVFIVNQQGEAMLQSLNMTAHMYSDYEYFY
ncbi:hypothetical protein EZV62_026682 [Acer yangbiense]|uniref:Uncharacterized protein n=1 Tax=Acer yangbiense TaxID=1000413 RepID=A0A5C7GRQ0_9ROSI|nr:hypothetical protein EZV62_026682 [Acer yangbiense]